MPSPVPMASFAPKPWPPAGRDRFAWWPSGLAILAVAAQVLLERSSDLQDPSDVPLWLFVLVIPISVIIVVFAILWIGSSVVFLFSWRWRRLVSNCVAPIVIIAAMRPTVMQYSPLYRFINSGELEVEAAKNGERIAVLDISQGLFAPPLTLLVYDETDRIGWSRDRRAELARIEGSKYYQSIAQGCIGLSERVVRHYYVCRP
jgi:hypothetical protein